MAATGKNTQRQKLRTLAGTGVLAAIIILMSFTPLGFLKIGAVEVTFIMIPVIIGAVIMGPVSGLVLGGVFGICSLIQCFGMSPFGTLLMGINPVSCVIMCVVSRVLAGWMCGQAFRFFRQYDKKEFWSYGAAGLLGSLLNTMLFIFTCLVFYGNNEQFLEFIGVGIMTFFMSVAVMNGLIEALTCTILAVAISKGVNTFMDASKA